MIPEGPVALAVDLDGTLVETDTLFESVLGLIRKNPRAAAGLPMWLLRGKTAFKSEVGRRVQPGVKYLPWRRDLVDYVRAEKLTGRRIVLATAANAVTAEAVAVYLGMFDEVFASDALVNLKGVAKRDALVRRFGAGGFDYVGDSLDDIPVWAASRVAHLAGRRRVLPAAAFSGSAVAGRIFASAPASAQDWLQAIRIHQWVKNVLLFAPVILSHRLNLVTFAQLLIPFFAFSFVSSGIYLINDLFDLEEDRRHARKRNRSLASGAISIGSGAAMALFLLAAGFSLSALAGSGMAMCLGTYMALALAYSSFLKNKPIIDVVALAVLYTLRIYTGGLVSHVTLSHWLFQFSIFLFLSLAFVKRYSELVRLEKTEDFNTGRGYRTPDLSIISQAGVGCGLLAGLVLALYVNGEDIQRLYPRAYLLWGVSPLFVYWITRVWLIAHRGNMQDDPILFAFKDRVSYIVGILILVLAAFGATPIAH